MRYHAGGPKLRKWYGQGERPTDGGGMQRKDTAPQEQEPEGPRDAVLVTDADSPTGEFIVLQLILARWACCLIRIYPLCARLTLAWQGL